MPRRAHIWLTCLAYAAITLIFVRPLIDYGHLTTASHEGDARLVIWTLAWDARAILSGSNLFDANMFYPAARAITWSEHHLGIALFALPVYALSHNPVLSYWIVWLLSFPLNALAMYALGWRLTKDRVAAFAAGIIYAFCFFRMQHAIGHLQMLWTWAIPLMLLALERWLEQPSPARTAAFTTLVLIQMLTTGYTAVFVALLLLVALAVMLPGRRLTPRHIRTGAVAVLVGGALLAWLESPYMSLWTPGISDAIGQGADLQSYLVPPENTWLGQWLLAHTSLKPRWIWGEQTLYAGMSALVLAAIGTFALATRRLLWSRTTAAILITGLVALALSFGPGDAWWSPFSLFAHLPAMSMLRAPGRFALLVMLAVATCGAYGAALVRRQLGAAGTAMVVVLCLTFLAESYLVALPAGRPRPFEIPAVYRSLGGPPGAVLSLPTYRDTPEAFREADYLFYSTAHWRPMVNGFGRHEPLDHRFNLAVLATFPSREATTRMRELGVQYVVIHTDRAHELRAAVESVAANGDIELLGRFGGDYLYGLRPQ